MFWKIAEFFIQNSKLTLVLIIISLLSGVWSYFIIPKQYNPTIIVPAFNVVVPVNWMTSREISKYIITPLENKIMELEWIDEVYGIAKENHGSVMVKFKVWEDISRAKISLNQKLNENIELKPIGVQKPIIYSIDPEILPQITYAITYSGNELDVEKQYIYLRHIANIIKNELKTINNLTTIDIVWWYKNNLIIDLDLEKIKSNNISILQVYNKLKSNNINTSINDLDLDTNEKISLSVISKAHSIKEFKNLIIYNNWVRNIYLKDIADVRTWIKKIDKLSIYNDKPWVFLWVWKAKWTNSVNLTDEVKLKIKWIKKTLPKNIQLDIIQNEWDTARKATNMLLINLIQSVIIVFIILMLYLWKKDAFNTAISIPLTLGLVFLLALLLWENINRITLFALILVLWMIVDNSTVVVENISRHLWIRANTWKTKLQAVVDWVQEVWVGVVLSTISRLLAFAAMFAVWGMMWEYMWAIPKFAIMALVISLIIAFTINPLLSYLGAKDITEKNRTIKQKKEVKYDIRKYYLSFMKLFIRDDKKSNKKRFIFKLVFWISLIIFIFWPILWGIFKARLLPKSDQNQVYLWIDAPRWWNTQKMRWVVKEVNNFFINTNNQIPEHLKIVDNLSITVWQSFMWDFANLFRWGLSRVWQNQLSARINLISKDKYKDKYNEKRIISENYTIQIRQYFREYILKKYPDLKIQLLEDPAWPPTRATFLAKIKTNANETNRDQFFKKVQQEIYKIKSKQKLVDIGDSISTTYRKINIKIDNELISKSGLTVEQVILALKIWVSSIDIFTLKNNNSLENTNLVLAINSNQNSDLSLLKKIFVINKNNEKIYLDSIAKIEYSFVDNEINSDNKQEVDYIFWEMWDNSLTYPILKLFWIFKSKDFLWNEYIIKSSSPYSIEYMWLRDQKQYIIEWWWEWELQVDTFKDLWLAMWLSLLAIYFLLVWQFASFWIAWIIMTTFLLSFYWIFPGFTILFLIQNEYFSATSMIWIIALWWIVVWNAIILIDYLTTLKKNWLTIEDALLKAWYVRFAPIILTSLTTVFWALTITNDPVWSWLAWSIIWWLLVSSILTLIIIPIMYYDSQKNNWK